MVLRKKRILIFLCKTFSQVNPTALEQLEIRISCPLGLVVKRITSMTFESANDKIASSILAEGILFAGGTDSATHHKTTMRKMKQILLVHSNHHPECLLRRGSYSHLPSLHFECRVLVNGICTKKATILFTRSQRPGPECKLNVHQLLHIHPFEKGSLHYIVQS